LNCGCRDSNSGNRSWLRDNWNRLSNGRLGWNGDSDGRLRLRLNGNGRLCDSHFRWHSDGNSGLSWLCNCRLRDNGDLGWYSNGHSGLCSHRHRGLRCLGRNLSGLGNCNCDCWRSGLCRNGLGCHWDRGGGLDGHRGCLSWLSCSGRGHDSDFSRGCLRSSRLSHSHSGTRCLRRCRLRDDSYWSRACLLGRCRLRRGLRRGGSRLRLR